mgnify:CR=1 FL=1
MEKILKTTKQYSSNTITKIIASLLIAVMVIGVMAVVTTSDVKKADAADNDVCSEGFYQYADNQLRRFDEAGGDFTDIGSTFATGKINASGYDKNTGRIYSLNGNFNSNNLNNSFVNLIYTDTTTGAVTTVGPVTNANDSTETFKQVLNQALKRPVGSNPDHNNGKTFSIGEAHNGLLYVSVGNQENQIPTGKDNNIYIVDLATSTYTKLVTSHPGLTAETGRIGPDMVYISGKLYSVNGQNGDSIVPTLNVIDIATGVITATDITGLPKLDDSYGALWLAKDPITNETKFYTYSNGGGKIYEISNYSTTPSAILKASGKKLTNNDGASCPDAKPPVFSIDAVDDAGTTTVNNPVNINWVDNDTHDPTNTIVIDTFDSTSVNAGTVTNNGDGTFKYQPQTGFYGTDTFTYTICLNDVTPKTCDSATITVTIPATIDAVDDNMGTTNGQTPKTITITDIYSNDTITEGLKLSLCTATSFTQPAHGEVTFDDGVFTYTANADYRGNDSYTYKICDEKGVLTDTATISIRVVTPDINVDKTDDDVSVSPGDDIVYTINYANTGDGDDENVVLTETVPANTTYSGDDTWTCEDEGKAGATCVYTIGKLAAGKDGSVTFTITVDTDTPTTVTTILNTVNISDSKGIQATDDETTPLVRVLGTVVTRPADVIPVQVLGTTADRGSLPYTGVESGLLVAIGASLLIMGLALRRKKVRLLK